MAKIKKEVLDTIQNLTPEIKADLSSLFDEIDTKDTEISKLQKERKDADQVVERAATLEKTVKERDDMITTLNAKLAALNLPPTRKDDNEHWGIFEPVRELFVD